MDEIKQQLNEDVNTINTFQILKTGYMMNPKLKKVMEGNYETVMNCQTTEELCYVMNRIKRRFYTNENIPYEERFQMYKYLENESTLIPETKALFHHVDKKTEEFMTNMFKELILMKNMWNSFKETHNINEEEYLRKQFDLLIQNINEKNKQRNQIQEMINPFFIDETNTLKGVRNELCKLLEKAPSHKLQQLINLQFFGNSVKIDDFEYSLDIDNLSKEECETIISELKK